MENAEEEEGGGCGETCIRRAIQVQPQARDRVQSHVAVQSNLIQPSWALVLKLLFVISVV